MFMALMVDDVVVDFMGSLHFILPDMFAHSSHSFYILGAIVVEKGGLYAIVFTHA